MKKPLKYKKFMIIFGGFLAFLLLLYVLWICLKAIFPLPPENGFTISQKETLCFQLPGEIYNHGSSHFTPLDTNRFVITHSTIPGYDQNPRFSDIFIVNENGETENHLRIDFDITGVYGFENGNFGAVLSDLDPFMENKEYFLREYNADFEIVSENPLLPEMIGERTYANGNFYVQNDEAIYIADKEMKNLITYDIPRLIRSDIGTRHELIFSNDNTPYLFTLTGDNETDNFYIETLDGERSQIFPDENTFLLWYSTTPGDERYDFFTIMFNEAAIDDPIFGEIAHANYLVGINKDGSLQKLMIEDDSTFPSVHWFRDAVPVGDKRYNLSGQYGDDDTLSFYLIEYTTSYKD
jgi:hypothetical protein